MGPYVILFAVGALHDHVANNDIRDAQHAIEFCNLGGISVEIDEGVDTVGQTIDLVSEFTLAPLVNVVDGTLSGRDNASSKRLDAPAFIVTGDADYVVAYGIKGNMVAYTVNYQDASGNSLAESQTFYGNVGDKPVVAYRYVENYIPDALALTKTLSDNESENIFTFTYKPGATDRVVTTTTTITTTVPGTATPGTGTGNAGTAGGTTGGTTGGTAGTTGGTTTGTAGTTGGTTTGTTGGTTDGTTTGTTDGTTTDNDSQDTTAKDKDTATSEDEQTPKSLVDLDDEDTPKGNIDAKDKTSKTPIAAGIGIIVVAVAALVGLIVFLKKRAK